MNTKTKQAKGKADKQCRRESHFGNVILLIFARRKKAEYAEEYEIWQLCANEHSGASYDYNVVAYKN